MPLLGLFPNLWIFYVYKQFLDKLFLKLNKTGNFGYGKLLTTEVWALYFYTCDQVLVKSTYCLYILKNAHTFEAFQGLY